jgi:hypothetical protein
LDRLVTVAEKLTVPPSRTWLAPLTVMEGCGCVPEPPPETEPHPESSKATLKSDPTTRIG